MGIERQKQTRQHALYLRDALTAGDGEAFAAALLEAWQALSAHITSQVTPNGPLSALLLAADALVEWSL